MLITSPLLPSAVTAALAFAPMAVVDLELVRGVSRRSWASMCEGELPPPTLGSGAAAGADVDRAAEPIKEELWQEKMRLIFDAPPPLIGEEEEEDGSHPMALYEDDGSPAAALHIQERDALVGMLDSAELLARDEEAGLWPQYLPKGDAATAKNMLWVDELSCIGCTWCADVARSTFRMERDAYGTARVIQQGGDPPETVAEAIDCCPSDCIHACTRKELELLEEHRALGHIDDLLARYHGGARLTSEGDGGGGVAVPHWKDPIVHQSWRKGDRYVKTRRLAMTDPLLHKSGTPTGMSTIGLRAGKDGWKAVEKENSDPSPINQDGTVIPPMRDDAQSEAS